MIIKSLIYPGIYPRSVVVGFIFFPPQNSRENKVCFLNFCSAQMVGKKFIYPFMEKIKSKSKFPTVCV